jgi:HK97 family phage portal protein
MLAAGNQSMNVNQGGIPQAVLKSQRKLTKEQAEALQEQWVTRMTARSGPPVLPPELDFETISFNPADLALLDTQEFSARAIATAFGVPSVLLNIALQGGLTYQNPAALGEMWWRFELRPTATRIANALSAQMLPRGQWVTFDAADTFAELTDLSDDDDPQLSQVAKASPAQQPRPLQAIGGST